MVRRIVTAREQYDMWEPWREAGSSYTDSEGRYMGPTRLPKHKPYQDAYSEDENGDCATCGVHFSQPHIGPHEAAKKVSAADGRHPDLLESERLYGTAHTTGGRVLPQRRIAATPEEQEARLAEPAGWAHHVAFPPSQRAIAGARQYAAARGLSDPHNVSYEHVMQDPDTIRQTGRAYDAMPDHDPNAIPHYDAFRREINDQYDHLTKNMGVNVQAVDHDPYPDAQHMVDDVDNNNRLQVLGTHVTGSHPYLSDEENDKFRAVHDYFGHAATGRSFDRHGEQAAYQAHSKMFSPQARPALATETKGQNSSLILNGQFPPQKIATLPQEMSARAASWYRHAGRGDEIYQQIQHSPGGVTWSPDGPPPQHGYMVSLPHAEKRTPFDQLNPHEIDQYLHQHPEISAEKPYGGWHEPPDWVHDVSKNIPDDQTAKQKALEWGQDAAFDLDAPMKLHSTEPVDQAYIRTNPWVNSGPASALGWTQANRRKRECRERLDQ